MNDAAYALAQARVERLCQRWLRPLGLGGWTIQWVWHRAYSPDDAADAAWQTTWDINSSWQYLTAQVNVYLPVVADLTDAALETSFLHEMSHILLAELRPERGTAAGRRFQPHEERTATLLGRALEWVYALGVADGAAAAQAGVDRFVEAALLAQCAGEGAG